MVTQHTCIRASDDDDLSGQIRDVLWAKLALGRETLSDDRSNKLDNAHGLFRRIERMGMLHINIFPYKHEFVSMIPGVMTTLTAKFLGKKPS